MKISGIYKITNLINGKVYIGQSKDIFRRYSEHFTEAKVRFGKSYLYYSMNKYGIENFSFQIIKETYDLDYWEKFFIYWYRSCESDFGYNLTTGGQKSNGRRDGFVYTDEIKRKMSESKRENWSNPEYKAKMLDAQNKGRMSETGKLNRSLATKNMWKNGKFANRKNIPTWSPKGRKMSDQMKEKMKIVGRERERKHSEDFQFYLSMGGQLNRNEFCKHYKNGVNELLEEFYGNYR